MPIPAMGDVLEYARHLGLRRTLYRSAYVMANQVVAVSIFNCLQLRPEDVNTALLASGGRYERRFLGPGEIRRFAGALGPSGKRVAHEALARGDACYAVLDGGRLASFSCYSPHPTPILNDLMVGFDPPRWYMYGAWTPVSHRGRRLHGLGVIGASLELFERGVPALVGVYERTNYRSMVSAQRMGWKPCGTLFRLGVGHWTRLGGSAEAQRIGIRLERRELGSRV